jgi:adenine-specific DNA-methyltransferase
LAGKGGEKMAEFFAFEPCGYYSGNEDKNKDNNKYVSEQNMQLEFLNSKGSSRMTLLGMQDLFSNPKPVDLIKWCINLSTTQNDLVLDFFAGSGTTGDAVMQLNAEDGGNRKYILVQLPEEIDKKKNKTAYDFVKDELKVENPTIFEITKERLLRAGKKIQEENKDKDLSNVDFGFKIFETTPIWEDYNLEAEEFDEQTKLFDESKLNNEDLKILLTTWKTYDGIPLTQDLNEIDLDGYKGYYFDNKLYLLNKGFTTKNLKKLLEEIDKNKDFNPATIIAFGYNFESKNLREISENIKNYANKKHIDVDFITRY